jgi:hypothetical protein
MSSNLFKWTKRISTIAIILVSFYLFYKFRKDFYLISNVSPVLVIILSSLVILTITINGNKLNQIIRSFNIKLRTNEWIGLAFISSCLNGVVFKSGSVVTSNFLKRKHNFPYTSFVGAMGADHFMMILINAFVGLIVSAYIMISHSVLYPLTGLFLLVLIFLIYFIRKPFEFSGAKNRFLDVLSRAARTLNDILQNKPLFWKLFFNNLSLVFIMGLRMYIACKAIGLDFQLLHCYLFTNISAFVRLIPMLHSDIGSREVTVGFLSEAIGLGFKKGVIATAFDRVFEMAWALIGVAIFKNLLFVPVQDRKPKNFLT